MDEAHWLVPVMRFLHLLAVVVSVGSALQGPFQRRQARQTGDPTVIAAAYAMHARTFVRVTLPWFVLSLLTGMAMTLISDRPLAGWLVWSLALIVVVMLLFAVGVLPLHKSATHAALAWSHSRDSERISEFERRSGSLEPMSYVALLLLVAVLALMVFRPNLPLPW